MCDVKTISLSYFVIYDACNKRLAINGVGANHFTVSHISYVHLIDGPPLLLTREVAVRPRGNDFLIADVSGAHESRRSGSGAGDIEEIRDCGLNIPETKAYCNVQHDLLSTGGNRSKLLGRWPNPSCPQPHICDCWRIEDGDMNPRRFRNDDCTLSVSIVSLYELTYTTKMYWKLMETWDND
ncbi:hypothetical protein EAG_04864 [Camponotus floridanus]|uniref:Uncharacterized protein n=1 Tax=Camponotus floridanus TaxID=104421 RepID=E2ASJ3_CAMFO|nr:hypothetical protein EAG_04864 [Camponotus floridanus]